MADVAIDVVRAGRFQGGHLALPSQPLIGARPADDAIAEELIRRQRDALSGTALERNLADGVHGALVDRLGKEWVERGREDGPLLRPAYIVHDSELGVVDVAHSDSRWARVLASRHVMAKLSEDERREVFARMADVKIRLGSGRTAFLPTVAEATAALSTNVVPVFEQDGTRYAVFTVRSDKVGDHKLAIATVGGGARPDDVGKDRSWSPLSTFIREGREEFADALGRPQSLLQQSLYVQADGNIAVHLVIDLGAMSFDQLLRGHMQAEADNRARSTYPFEHGGLLRVPLTGDGLESALVAPQPDGARYQPYPWTPWAVGAAFDVAKATRLDVVSLAAAIASAGGMVDRWTAARAIDPAAREITEQLPSSQRWLSAFGPGGAGRA